MEAEDGAVVSGCPGCALHKSRTNPAKDCGMSGALHRLDNVSSMPEDHQGAHICEKKIIGGGATWTLGYYPTSSNT